MKFSPGVLYGQELADLWRELKNSGYALPSVNVTSGSTVNAALEAAKQRGQPIIIQISNGGAAFYAGGSLDNASQQASIAGAVAMAQYVHQMASEYGVVVVLNTDHCQRKLLPWLNGLFAHSKKYYEQHGKPLFSMHMLDLSEESFAENVATAEEYLQKFAAIEAHLEVEIGVTGGEEDGVDNSEVDHTRLYSQPEEIVSAYDRLNKISPNFLIAAAFGNVHGVYAPGNVKLRPEILSEAQQQVAVRSGLEKEINFVFHGGSGSAAAEIAAAVAAGVVKMNVDTDLQWAYWDGVRSYYLENQARLQSQIGHPGNSEEPNKKYYDPRKWLRAAEQKFCERVHDYYDMLGAPRAG